MNPPDAKEYLLLVNAANPLEAAYVPADLTEVGMTRQDGRATQKLRLYAEKALEALFAEMNSAGFSDVTVTGGYVSYAEQTAQFEGFVADQLSADPSLEREQAEEIVTTYSPRPGTSDYQTTNHCSLSMHPAAHLVARAKMKYVVFWDGAADYHALSVYNPDGSVYDNQNLFIKGGDIDGNGLASCLAIANSHHFTLADITLHNGLVTGLC